MAKVFDQQFQGKNSAKPNFHGTSGAGPPPSSSAVSSTLRRPLSRTKTSPRFRSPKSNRTNTDCTVLVVITLEAPIATPREGRLKGAVKGKRGEAIDLNTVNSMIPSLPDWAGHSSLILKQSSKPFVYLYLGNNNMLLRICSFCHNPIQVRLTFGHIVVH